MGLWGRGSSRARREDRDDHRAAPADGFEGSVADTAAVGEVEDLQSVAGFGERDDPRVATDEQPCTEMNRSLRQPLASATSAPSVMRAHCDRFSDLSAYVGVVQVLFFFKQGAREIWIFPTYAAGV